MLPQFRIFPECAPGRELPCGPKETTDMKVTDQFWKQSILVRLGIAMGLIAVLALASILSSAIFTERSEGKAGAINLAGSLRMQSYLIASTVASLHFQPGDKQRELERNIAEFERRLENPTLVGSVPRDANTTLRRAYERVRTLWGEQIRPDARRAVADSSSELKFLRAIPPFVADVDHLVKLLEDDLEGKIRSLRLYQGIALFLILFVIFLAMYLMHTQVLVPLKDLLAASRAVRSGDFSVRAANTGADELGQLGQAFNYMVQDLSKMYSSLESRVAEKTAELEITNRSLELLYNTTRVLSERTVTNETLSQVLGDLERAIGVQAGVICAHEAGQLKGVPLVSSSLSPDGRPQHCRVSRCADCFSSDAMRERSLGAEGSLISVPLAEGGRVYGVMPITVPTGRRLEPWQLKLAEAVGRHIGTALATARRAEARHRIALLEERSVIARELHDSLAQSLSYLKIQVTRLQALLGRGAKEDEVSGIVDELKGGLSNAYRQLRELLTTFRLRIEGRGLAAALEETVREFSGRTGLDIELVNELTGVELTSGEEIHVLQVIREALSNVEHHAQAKQARISLLLEPGNHVRVHVDDDGRGIGEGKARTHHYGLVIMRDRAASLNGTVDVRARAQGGTRVELVFTTAKAFPAAAAVAS
jgi:two-component system nitrate/nitrite sensor histidine kinase NarX